MKTITAYKFVNEDMKSKNGDQKWEVGKWYKHEGELSICSSGFHACESPLSSLKYPYGDRWFEVEAGGKIIREGGTVVASEMRLVRELDVKKILVPFSYLCARRNLENFEKVFPNDDRPRKAIEAAEAYANCPCEKHKVASQFAFLSAESAKSAAWSMARSADSAAWSAARSAESAVQSAKSAASSAAWSAASSAKSAASSAASSAESAARSAVPTASSVARSAEFAERKWQEEQLKELIRKV